MKKLITVLFTMLLFGTTFAQIKGFVQNDPKQYYHVVQEGFDYGKHTWYSYNNFYGVADWSISSLYWGISKSTNKDKDGDYEYKIWFLSNSYTWDYYRGKAIWKYTFISEVKIYVNNIEVASCPDGFSFRELYNAPILSFYNSDSTPIILFRCSHKIL